MIAVALLVTSTVLLAQSPVSADSIRVLALRASPGLPAIVRQLPDSARAALTRTLALTAAASRRDVRATHLDAARRLAAAYAVAWRDSFFVRRVDRFARWSPSDRSAKVAADNIRRLGGEALGRDGADAATRLWHESLQRSRRLGDSAGMAATLGNVAAGLYTKGELDTAEAVLRRSNALAANVGDFRTLGNGVGLLANVRRDRGDLTQARTLYARALALRDKTGDDRGAAADENNLGMIAQELGDTLAARRAFESALARNRRGNRAAAAARNLTNLATLADRTGDMPRAASLYDEAIRLHRGAGDRAELGLVLHNVGILELRQSDYRAAARALTEASDILESTGPPADAIAARTDLAEAHSAMGALQPALAEIARASSLAEKENDPAVAAAVAIARADLALDFNALGDAERLYTSAAALYRRAGDRNAELRAREGLATLLVHRRQFVGARTTFDTVRREYEARGDRRSAALTRLATGWVLLAAGDTAGAESMFTEARATLGVIGDRVGEAEALHALGEIQLARARPTLADSMFRRGLMRLGGAPAPTTAASLRFGRARALRGRGALTEAAAELRTAIEATERGASRVRLSDQRAAFMADKWEMFGELALIERKRGRDAAAFEVSERMRARQMLDLVAEGRMSRGAAASDSLVGREQDLRHRIAALEKSLEDAPRAGPRFRGPPTPLRPDAATQMALRSAEKEYAQLLLAIRERSPEYARLVTAKTVGEAEVRERLRVDEALLEYLVTDSTTLLFVVTRRAIRVIDLSITRHALAAAVDFTRATIAAPTADRPAELWRPPLARLHTVLIEPAEFAGALAGIRHLVIAPHADLHYLPFAALVSPETGRFLVERFDLSYVPSASVWATLASRPAATSTRNALVVVPRPDLLPATRGEATAIRRALGPSTRVLLDGDATARAFRDESPHYSVIHLATLGVLNKHNPLFSYIQLAPDSVGNGRLDVHEVFGLTLRARLVVLSACQTALASGATADVPAGDDWVGLVRAFLFAGADNVMATLWPVEDRSAARLMRAFYEQAGPDHPAASLARAQRAAIRDAATGSPAQWAAFTVVGAPH